MKVANSLSFSSCLILAPLGSDNFGDDSDSLGLTSYTWSASAENTDIYLTELPSEGKVGISPLGGAVSPLTEQLTVSVAGKVRFIGLPEEVWQNEAILQLPPPQGKKLDVSVSGDLADGGNLKTVVPSGLYSSVTLDLRGFFKPYTTFVRVWYPSDWEGVESFTDNSPDKKLTAHWHTFFNLPNPDTIEIRSVEELDLSGGTKDRDNLSTLTHGAVVFANDQPLVFSVSYTTLTSGESEFVWYLHNTGKLTVDFQPEGDTPPQVAFTATEVAKFVRQHIIGNGKVTLTVGGRPLAALIETKPDYQPDAKPVVWVRSEPSQLKGGEILVDQRKLETVTEGVFVFNRDTKGQLVKATSRITIGGFADKGEGSLVVYPQGDIYLTAGYPFRGMVRLPAGKRLVLVTPDAPEQEWISLVADGDTTLYGDGEGYTLLAPHGVSVKVAQTLRYIPPEWKTPLWVKTNRPVEYSIVSQFVGFPQKKNYLPLSQDVGEASFPVRVNGPEVWLTFDSLLVDSELSGFVPEDQLTEQVVSYVMDKQYYYVFGMYTVGYLPVGLGKWLCPYGKYTISS